MPRYFLKIEYDGTNYAGWQRQKNAPSIQQCIDEAASKLNEKPISSYAAGRTDTGVHARGMVAHLDLAKDLADDRVMAALNFYLRDLPISILAAKSVSNDLHARFSCYRRAYQYIYQTRRAPLALDQNRVWHVGRDMDIDAMNQAAQFLVGKHDFTTFRSVHCQSASALKTLDFMNITRDGDLVILDCHAPSFLHNQIRSFAGTLHKVGIGRWTAAMVKDALDAKDRHECGPVAPSMGLYFMRADYDGFSW